MSLKVEWRYQNLQQTTMCDSDIFFLQENKWNNVSFTKLHLLALYAVLRQRS